MRIPRGNSALAVLGCAAVLTGCGGAARTAAVDAGAERVAVGYGTEERRNLTVSVGSVTGKKLRQDRTLPLAEVLASRVPGLRVENHATGGVSIRIRGARPGPAGEPLVVVDGTPILSHRVATVFSTLSSQQIARVDVLKDAGSTAAYGSRGANGVILITTRRGR